MHGNQWTWIRDGTALFWDETERLFLLDEQFFNLLPQDLLSLDVIEVQLAVPAIADVAFLVDEVNAGPEAIVPSRPILAGVVHDDGILHVIVFYLTADLVDLALGRGLGRVNADHG